MRSEQIALIELDALLDTRIATVHALNEDAPFILIQEGYRTRLSDRMDILSKGIITQEAYRERYANRDMAVLEFARPTDFLFELKSIAVKADLLSESNAMVDRFKILLNIYPYKVPEDTYDTLIDTILYYMDTPCTVEIVNLSPKQCGPAYLKANVGAFFLYNFNEWVAANTDTIATVLNPSIEIMAPAIMRDEHGEDFPEHIIEETGETTDVYQITESMFTPAFSLTLADIKYFSAIELN